MLGAGRQLLLDRERAGSSWRLPPLLAGISFFLLSNVEEHEPATIVLVFSLQLPLPERPCFDHVGMSSIFRKIGTLGDVVPFQLTT